MKTNWGTKIAALYTAFVAFILFMVYLSVNQKFDLVTEDYYAEEIAYQSTIDSKTRADNLKQRLIISLDGKQLRLAFPHQNQIITGNITCFRPSDESLDFKESVSTEDGTFFIPLEKFTKGKYILKVNWLVNDVSYYEEQTIVLP